MLPPAPYTQECKKSCPVVRMGKLCMEVEKTSPMVYISESLCIGCGICVKKVNMDETGIGWMPRGKRGSDLEPSVW